MTKKIAIGLGILVAFFAPGIIAGFLGWYFTGDGGQFYAFIPYLVAMIGVLAHAIGATVMEDE